MMKSVKYEDYADSEAVSAEVSIDADDETPIKICMRGGEMCRWMSTIDAKAMVKCINAALRELK